MVNASQTPTNHNDHGNTQPLNDSASPSTIHATTTLIDSEEAPHHTITGDSDNDSFSDGDASTNVGSLIDSKSIRSQKFRVSDHYKDDDDDDDDDTKTLQAGDSAYSDSALKRDDDLEASSIAHLHRASAGAHAGGANDFDDEYEARASLQGTAGFTDRRGTPSRLAPKSAFSRFWEIGRETLPTLIVSVVSLMFSGELLVHLARWPVFRKVDKLFILIPILLNMKGNLEMNLSLRMSTSANIGELDVRRTRETLIRGNMALLQVQALIVSMFAGVLAFVLGVTTPDPQIESPTPVIAPSPSSPGQSGGQTPENALIHSIVRSAFSAVTLRNRRRSAPSAAVSSGPWLQKRRVIHHHPKPPVDPALRLRNGYFEFVLVIATSMLSASLSSATLGSFMCALVLIARRSGANPDNIASPLAACLGDLTTLTLLGLLASALVHFEGTFLATVILAALTVVCMAFFIVTFRNAYVRELLASGWVPLIVAMFISSGAGLVLDEYVGRYQGFALLSPVLSGLPGACAAIFASRITTALHSGKGATLLRATAKAGSTRGIRGVLASLRSVMVLPPIEGWLVPLSLLTMGVSIMSTFIILIGATGQMSFGWIFLGAFIGASVVANIFALYLAHVICLLLWSRDYDPDIYSAPFVSSIVDVAGQNLLVLVFMLATKLGDHITAVVNAGAGHGGV